MGTLREVREAYLAGDREQAIRLLSANLRRTPSADAWYVAATLTADRRKAVRYLRHALLLDPNHADTHVLLDAFGVADRGRFRVFVDDFEQFLQRQASKSRLFRKLNGRQQAWAAGAVLGFTVIALVLLVSLVLQQGGTPQAPVQPGISLVTAAEVAQHMERSPRVRAFQIAEASDLTSSARQVLRFNAIDRRDRVYPFEILVYPSPSALIADRPYLDYLETSTYVVAAANAVLVYPPTVSAGVAEDLSDHFRELVRTDTSVASR